MLVTSCATESSSKTLHVLNSGNLTITELPDKLPDALDVGMLARLSGHYTQSESAFNVASKQLDNYLNSYHNGTLGNIVDTIDAAVLSPSLLPYQIKDYEQVLLLSYRALNAVALGDVATARIFIQQMYQLEQVIYDFHELQYVKTANKSAQLPQANTDFAQLQQHNQYDFTSLASPAVLSLKNSYQNAFSHYLAGFIFEELGETSLARAGYIKALQLQPNANIIQTDISRLDNGKPFAHNSTDVLLVVEVGHAPQLHSRNINIPFMSHYRQHDCINSLSISFPQLIIDTSDKLPHITLIGHDVALVPLTNVNLMAQRYWHDNLFNVFISNLLRASTDIALQETACRSGGGGLLNIATVGASIWLNRSDERTWVSLPASIYIQRLSLAYGTQTLSIKTSAGKTHILSFKLSEPHQVIGFRVIGENIFQL